MRARFADPVLVGLGGGGETSLFIADDGTMLACSHAQFRKPSSLWASADNGATWALVDVLTPIPSGDCDVAITDDGTWHMLYNYIASSAAASSTDKGTTWQVTPVTGYPVAGAMDRPRCMPDGNEITMTYAKAAASVPAVHLFTRSTHRGLTWPVHPVMGHAEGGRNVQKIPGHPVSGAAASSGARSSLGGPLRPRPRRRPRRMGRRPRAQRPSPPYPRLVPGA